MLNHPSYKVQVPSLRTIGNIITGSEKQTQVLLDLNVLPLLYRLLQSPRKGKPFFSSFSVYLPRNTPYHIFDSFQRTIYLNTIIFPSISTKNLLEFVEKHNRKI